MNDLTEAIDICCPYCGEYFTAFVEAMTIDTNLDEQTYIEDCQVCCRPIEFRISFDHQDLSTKVNVRRDDE